MPTKLCKILGQVLKDAADQIGVKDNSYRRGRKSVEQLDYMGALVTLNHTKTVKRQGAEKDWFTYQSWYPEDLSNSPVGQSVAIFIIEKSVEKNTTDRVKLAKEFYEKLEQNRFPRKLTKRLPAKKQQRPKGPRSFNERWSSVLCK